MRSTAVCAAETTEEAIDEKVSSEINLGISASLDGKRANFKDVDSRAVKFVEHILDELYSTMILTAAVFRWRCGAEGPPDPVRNLRGFCSSDGVSWREVGMFRGLKISFGIPTGPLPPPDVIRNDIAEMIKAGMEEPLGHQLFREAWSQRQVRPRSALVIGVAAAEVGFKKLVGSLVPRAQWLMDEVQTPSLEKMLRKFLPILPVKCRFQGKSIRPPNVLLNKLGNAIECRNKLVHAGQPPPSGNELATMLRAVSDLLWICDLYSGHDWAHKYIPEGTLMAWQAEDKHE